MAARKKASKKKATRKTQGAGPLAPRLAIAGLRIFVGLIFLDAVQYKLFSEGLPLADAIDKFVRTDYVGTIERAVASPPKIFGHPFTAFTWFLEHVMLADGWKTVFATAILLFEGLLGLSLVLGAATRIFAVLGAFLMAAFGLAKGMYVLTGSGSNWLLVAILLVLTVLAAGRFFGLDARWRDRLPRWVA